LLKQWREYRGEPLWPSGSTIEDCFIYPMIYEPGEEWSYGPSIEWTGRLIGRINGGITLDVYMQEHICRPLGIKDLTFYLQKRPEMLAKHAEMTDRDTGKETYHFVDADYYHKDPEECFGGMAIYTSPESYMKVLHSLVTDDGKLIQPSTLQKCFAPQLSESAQATMMGYFKDPFISALIPPGLKVNHGLGGALIMEDVPGMWNKGTLHWSGLPNIYWFIDPESGLSALYASQIRPYSDKRSLELCTLFFRTMYERFAAQK